MTGLGPAGASDGDGPLTDAPQEPPGTAPLRAPWPVRGRGSGRVPAGYQVGRWAVLSGVSALTVATVTGAVVAAAERFPF